MRLLLVEDNERLAQLVADGLKKAGFDVDSSVTASDAVEALKTTRYAAIILDLGLPDKDGRHILRDLRGRGDPTPIVILTARGSVEDRVEGLREGADVYLTKPFAFEELQARLEVLLRRPGELLGRSLHVGNLTFDTDSRQVFVNGVPQVLPPREVTILELLIRRQGLVVPKRVLEDQLFGGSQEFGSNAIEVYIHRLRQRLAGQGADAVIHMVRGVGYIISSAEKRDRDR